MPLAGGQVLRLLLSTDGHALSRTRPDLFEPPVLRFLRGLPE